MPDQFTTYVPIQVGWDYKQDLTAHTLNMATLRMKKVLNINENYCKVDWYNIWIQGEVTKGSLTTHIIIIAIKT